MEIFKILYEYENPEVSVEEVLTESGQTKKKYRIKGTFSTIAERNRNGRIYPRHLWEAAVSKYQDTLKSGAINRLMEWEHPPRNTVDPMQAVAAIDSLRIEGNRVIGEATIFDNEKGNQLKNLIDNGIKISVSSRGTGKVGNGGVVEKFDLITYDLVSAPSDRNGTMDGVCESAESYLLTESGEFKQITAEEVLKLEEAKKSKDIDAAKILVEAFGKAAINEDLNPIAIQVDRLSRDIKKIIKDIRGNAKLNHLKSNINRVERYASDFMREIEIFEKELY